MIKTKPKQQPNIPAEIAGWYGILAILAAYLLVSFGIVAANSLLFQLLNLTGALGIIIISLHKRVMQSVVLNVVWIGVAVAAIVRIVAG